MVTSNLQPVRSTGNNLNLQLTSEVGGGQWAACRIEPLTCGNLMLSPGR